MNQKLEANIVFNNAVVCFNAMNYFVNKKTSAYTLNDVFLFAVSLPKFFKDDVGVAALRDFFVRFNI